MYCTVVGCTDCTPGSQPPSATHVCAERKARPTARVVHPISPMNAVRHALHSARLAPLALDVRLSSSVHQAPRSLRFEQWRVSSVARMPRLPPAPRCRHFRPPSAGGRGLVTVVERDVHGAGQAGVRRNAKRWWARCFGKARRSALVSPRIASILGNGSFVLVALSFLSTDILTLRVLNVAAGGELNG